MDYKIILGSAAVIISFGSYLSYYKSIFFGQTKPHLFSWLIWFIIQAVGFFAQISKGGGAGSWVTGIGGLFCFSIFTIAIFKGEKNITFSDKLSLAGAVCAIIFWIITKNALAAVVLVTISDCLAFLPTFRKTYSKPYEESLGIYWLHVIVWILSLLSLEAFNLTTALYPATLVLTNGLFVIMSLIRRKALKTVSSKF